MDDRFQCIQCGCHAEKLYHTYKAGITKVANCKLCGQIVDKYVEYDTAIILLDVLLLQKSAYAHLLFNIEMKSHWKSAVLLWVVEAFVKLIQQRSEQADSHIPDSYVGVDLYLNYIMAVIDLLVFLMCVLAMLTIRSLLLTRSLKLLNPFFIVKAVLLANLGSILAMPAVLWGKSYSPILVWLGQGFVCMSALQALRVVVPGSHKTVFAAFAVAFGMTVRALLSDALNQWLHRIL